MAWVLNIILAQFVLTMVFTGIFYIIWRLSNPGKKW